MKEPAVVGPRSHHRVLLADARTIAESRTQRPRKRHSAAPRPGSRIVVDINNIIVMVIVIVIVTIAIDAVVRMRRRRQAVPSPYAIVAVIATRVDDGVRELVLLLFSVEEALDVALNERQRQKLGRRGPGRAVDLCVCVCVCVCDYMCV